MSPAQLLVNVSKSEAKGQTVIRRTTQQTRTPSRSIGRARNESMAQANGPQSIRILSIEGVANKRRQFASSASRF